MGAAEKPVLAASRLCTATKGNLGTGADDEDITSYNKANSLIVVAQVDEAKGPWNSSYTLMWRNVTDGGSFANLASTGECKWATDTDLVNGQAVTSRLCSNAPVGSSWQNGEEVEGAAISDAINLADEYYTEIHFAVSLADAHDGDQYEFQLWEDAGGSAVGTLLAQITTEIAQQTYTKTVSLDSYLKKIYTKTPSLDAYLKAMFTKTPSADGILSKADLTKTASADSLLSKLNLTKITSLDASLYLQGTKTIDLDALLKKLDAVKETSIDGLLQKLGLTKTSSLDACLILLGMKSVGLDGLLKKDGISGSISMDAVLTKLGLSTSASIDALLGKLDITTSISIDGVLWVMIEKAISLDAYLKQIMEKIISLDAYLMSIGLPAITALDALLLKTGMMQVTSLDAILYQQGSEEKILSIDGILQKLSQIKALSLDAYLQRFNEKTSVMDAFLVKGLADSIQIDALLAKEMSGYAMLDAILIIEEALGIRLISLDSILQASFSMAVGLDADLISIPAEITCRAPIGMTFDDEDRTDLGLVGKRHDKPITRRHTKPWEIKP